MSYKVSSPIPINKRVFMRHGIWDVENWGVNTYYVKGAMAEDIKKLSTIPDITIEKMSVDPLTRSLKKWEPGEGQVNVYPDGAKLSWNEDNYGPLMIPAKGSTIEVNADNLLKYGYFIQNYEGHDSVTIEDQKLTIDGKQVDEYTFQPGLLLHGRGQSTQFNRFSILGFCTRRSCDGETSLCVDVY